jgi:hypothetical protein
MVWDEARLRRGHRNDQSRQGHQCSETTLQLARERYNVARQRYNVARQRYNVARLR